MTQTELEHLSVKSTLYTPYGYPWGQNFGSFRSKTSGFPSYHTFYNYPLTTMLNGQKKKKKNKRICQKFHNSLSNFGRYPPQEYAWFFESEYGAYFQERCCLKFLLPYGPMLMKTEKKS